MQITLYDETTFDRYYFAVDEEVTSAKLSEVTDENFAATVKAFAPGIGVSSTGALVDGLPAKLTFENGGIRITVSDGSDLTAISEDSCVPTVNF